MFDDKLSGRQTVTFEPDDEAGSGSRVLVELDYELNEGGPLRAIANLIFIRRALRDSIRRTLERFAVEAAEEADCSARRGWSARAAANAERRRDGRPQAARRPAPPSMSAAARARLRTRLGADAAWTRAACDGLHARARRVVSPAV